MPTLTNLVVNLTGDSSKLNKAVDKAARSLKRLGGRIAKAGVIGAAAGVAIGGIAVAGLNRWFKSARKTIDQTAKLADAFGLTEREIKALGLAAQLGGGELKPLLKALQRGTDNTREFALGISESKGLNQAFKDASISATGAQAVLEQGLLPAFIAVGAKVDAIKDPVARLTAGQEIFGKRAIESIPGLLTLGTEYKNLAKFTDFWRGSTDKLSGAMEDFNDQSLLTETAISLFGERVAVSFARPLASAQIKLRNMAGEFIKAQGGVDRFVEVSLVKLRDGFDVFLEKAERVIEVIKIMAAGIGLLSDLTQRTGVGIGALLGGARPGAALALAKGERTNEKKQDEIREAIDRQTELLKQRLTTEGVNLGFGP